jgi:hypothetical protein
LPWFAYSDSRDHFRNKEVLVSLVPHVQANEQPAFAGMGRSLSQHTAQVTGPFDAAQLVSSDAGFCKKGDGGAGCVKDCVATANGEFCHCDESVGSCTILTVEKAKVYDEEARAIAEKAADGGEQGSFLTSPFFFLLLALCASALIAAGAMYAGGQGYGDSFVPSPTPKPT